MLLIVPGLAISFVTIYVIYNMVALAHEYYKKEPKRDLEEALEKHLSNIRGRPQFNEEREEQRFREAWRE